MKIKMPLEKALSLAERVKDVLSSDCEKIEIAGSIRRERAIIGDIEVVAIPKLVPDLPAQLSLLGEPPKLISALDLVLDRLTTSKDNFSRGNKNGELYKNFLIEIDEDGTEVGLDLFLTTKEQWGYILALRTGPGDFNKAWVTQESKGGLLYDKHHFAGGWLRGPDGTKIPTPDEKDLFNFIRGGIITPTERENWRQHYEVRV